MTTSSFYTDGETYDTAVVTPNDHGASTTPSQAPSSFYPDGQQYASADPTATDAARDQAVAAAAAALASQNASHTSETNAASSEAAASTSAANAAASETNAAASETAASSSASASATSETNAAASAANAYTNATSAAGSASAASTSATNAHTSETNAASSASSAASSASAAATSATNAAATVQAAAGAAAPIVDGTAAVGTGTKWAREDHVHPTDTSRAPVASPVFTGTPTAPTPTAGDNSTKIATTAFVLANGGGVSGPVSSHSSALAKYSNTVGNSLADTQVYVDTSNNLGVQNTSPLGPLHVGAGSVTNSINPGVLLSRNETRSGVNAHGFSDSTNFIGSASAAYCPYDCRITLSGSGTVDHIAAFQAAETINGTVVLANHYGLYDAPTVNSGASLTTRYGVCLSPVGGSGTVGQELGIYIPLLERGAVDNYAIFGMPSTGSGHYAQSHFHNIVIGSSGGDYPYVGHNWKATTTTGSYKYHNSDTSAAIRFGASGGKIQTFTAASGSAGAAISFTAGPEVVQGATSWSAPSDERLKENVQHVTVLDKLKDFEFVSYTHRSSGKREMGVIAQIFAKVFPSLVNKGLTEEEMWTVIYDRMGAAALGGLKELLVIVNDQAIKIAALEAKLLP